MSIPMAQHRNEKLFRYVVVASLCGSAVFLYSGFTGVHFLFPLGIVVYNAVYATELILYVHRELQIPLQEYGRAIPDIVKFFHSRKNS
jgi:hypothetical protein